MDPSTGVSGDPVATTIDSERLKLLSLKRQSYSTTEQQRLAGDLGYDEASGIGQQQGIISGESSASSSFATDSSYTLVLSLDGGFDESASAAKPQQPFKINSLTTTTTTTTSTVQIWGCRRNSLSLAITVLLSVLTIGLLPLVLYWKPKWRARMLYSTCSLTEATTVLVRDEHCQWSLEQIRMVHRNDGITFLDFNGQPVTVPMLSYFEHSKLRFVLHPIKRQFQLLRDFDQNVPLNAYYERQELGLNKQMASARAIGYGPNHLNVDVTPIALLLFREALQPLCVFQVFSICLWMTQNYVLFSLVILFMTIISVGLNVYKTRRSQKDIRRMIGDGGQASVMRDGIVQTLQSKELVPGDVILLEPESDSSRVIDYDAVLISGGCVVNESGLTGESVPVTKTPLAFSDAITKEVYDSRHHAKHTLFSGTKLMQIRSSVSHPAKAVVIRTAFNTSKGRLIRSILYTKPIDFQFTKDLLMFLAILGLIALIGMIYAVVILSHSLHSSVYSVVERTLDIITIVVPPLLPTAMSVGVVIAQQRLLRKRIFCTSPSTINVCGAIDLVCFDKTGTLTEDGLSADQVRASLSGKFDEEKSTDELASLVAVDRSYRDIVRTMAACHTLISVEQQPEKLTGDPMDLALFEKTNWRFAKPNGLTLTQHPSCVAVVEGQSGRSSSEDKDRLLILQQFVFTSNLRRMSVIALDHVTGGYKVYCKGAPETIKSLCRSQSIPVDFDRLLTDYARAGCRVVALAAKKLSNSAPQLDEPSLLKHWSRDKVESDMTFVGMVILENRLKPATTGVIHDLIRANIRPVMVTGDHAETAVHVARHCGILRPERKLYSVDYDAKAGHPTLHELSDKLKEELHYDRDGDYEAGSTSISYEFVVTGPTLASFSANHPELLPRLISVCSVFARMSPEQKSQIVSLFQSIGYTVGACGDGANDCGALKTAHAGISLSDAEASVASPFTSQITDISCVPALISEGRAALVTSFGLAKYMVAYSFIQFFSVCILYSINTDVTSSQFVVEDLFIVTILSVLFGRTPSEERLHPHPPPNRLVSPPIILGIILHAAVTAIFQAMSFAVITFQPWYDPQVYRLSDYQNNSSMQGTAVFLCSLYQFIWMAFVFSKGHPFRKPFYHNWVMMLAGLIQLSLCIWLTLEPGPWASNQLMLMPAASSWYRIGIVLAGFLNLAIYVFTEMVIVEYICLKKLNDPKRNGLMAVWLSGRRRQPTMYERIHRLIGDNPNWLITGQRKI